MRLEQRRIVSSSAVDRQVIERDRLRAGGGLSQPKGAYGGRWVRVEGRTRLSGAFPLAYKCAL